MALASFRAGCRGGELRSGPLRVIAIEESGGMGAGVRLKFSRQDVGRLRGWKAKVGSSALTMCRELAPRGVLSRHKLAIFVRMLNGCPSSTPPWDFRIGAPHIRPAHHKHQHAAVRSFQRSRHEASCANRWRPGKTPTSELRFSGCLR